jgi:salicylate hydroxylase
MGGMGTALALAKEGYETIHVWESAPALGEVGAGINLPPNLARILDSWDVLRIAQAEGVLLTKAHVLGELYYRQGFWRVKKLTA